EDRLRTSLDRRHGGGGDEVVGRLCLGLQELRRRRAVRHGGAGLRLARPDGLGADDARRQGGRGRGRPRHGDPALPRASEGQGDLDQLDRLDLRLDPRPVASRQARQQRRAGEVRGYAGEGLRRHRRSRLHDQGSRASGRLRPALALHHGLPRQGRGKSYEGDGGVSMSDLRKAAVAALLFAAAPFGATAAELPGAVAAPGETVVLTTHAEGAQVYECKAGPDGKLSWVFREPIATLMADGKTVGRHYAGPNWEHVDGSVVTAKTAGSAPGATANDIAWLKLEVIAHRGSGVLSGVTTVQRINTAGGKLDGACEKAGATRSAPYSADYVFLKKG